MRTTACAVLLTTGLACACSSPASVEVSPDPLVLEGVGAEGQFQTRILDEDGAPIASGYDVVWLGLDSKVAKVQQDGRVQAQSTGKILVDVEVVGTEVHGVGHVEVRIPGSVVASHDELALPVGGPSTTVWAELRSDVDMVIEGWVPTWKVDDQSVVKLEAPPPGEGATRAFAKLTPLKAGETYATATYKDLAADIRVVVVEPTPPEADETAAP